MTSKKLIDCALTALVAGLFLQNAQAAGQIDLVSGNVSVTSASGQLRVPGKGERLETGDAIVTGRDGEVHVHMDDDGLIAVRANTFLRIEAYRAEGGPQDSAVFRLLRGSFRSVTGWIGKANPQNYAVRTTTATIGIRGTDHETMVIGEGADAGTYDKVNSGETEMETPVGKVRVLPGQAAFTPRAAAVAPKLLDTVPAFFVTSKNEALIDASKQLLEEARDGHLREKQQENKRKGADSGGKPQIGDPEEARKALAAFEDILRDFEAGNVSRIRQRLDPSMIGYQQLLDNITLENNECKQMRVTLLNTQVQAGPNVAVLQTSWEKRCLLLPSFTPRLTTGRSTILLHLDNMGGNGSGNGRWTFAAISGGNMLERSSSPLGGGRSLATLAVVNSGASYAAAAGGVAPPSPLPFSILVTDPDRAGAASINVVVTTNAPFAADTMLLTLPAVAPGSPQFAVNSVNFSKAASGCTSPNVPVNPTSLEICPGGTATVSFTDTTTPSGASQVVTQTVTVR
jgi:FecR protein